MNASPGSSATSWWQRLAARDPGQLALGRGLRAMIVGPAIFGIAFGIFDNATIGVTAMFGAVSALVFADFGGRPRRRVLAYLALGVVGAALLSLGTLVSGSTGWSVLLAFLIGAGVRFAGNLGPLWSAAVSPVILSFVLGALVPAPASVIPERAFGWMIALVVSAVASITIFAGRPIEEIEAVAADAADELAAAIRVATTSEDPEVRRRTRTSIGATRTALRTASLLPTRPTGPGAGDVARRVILDRLARLVSIVDGAVSAPFVALADEMLAVGEYAARSLERSAAVLRHEADVAALPQVIAEWSAVRDAALSKLEMLVGADAMPDDVVERVDAGFVARAGGVYAATIARNVAFLVGGHVVPGPDADAPDLPVPAGSGSAARIAHFFEVHRHRTSVWFQNAARAGTALALAVLVARVLAVDHAFWVALATLSVLRSNAMSTGQSAVGSAIGTSVGFGVSAGLLAVVGLNQPALVVMMVVGVFALAYLPQVVNFTVGQIAFTVMVVALFNLIEPQGWKTGLVRLEDVLIGVVVSAVVALVFWPERVEPLVAQLVTAETNDAGHLLTAVLLSDDASQWASSRQELLTAEARARAALAELLTQDRRAPEVAEHWIARFSVAAQTRAAADAVAALYIVLPGPADVDLQRALVASADALTQAILDDPTSPDHQARHRVVEQTRGIADAAVTAHPDAAAGVVRQLLTRDWLLALAGTVDDRL